MTTMFLFTSRPRLLLPPLQRQCSYYQGSWEKGKKRYPNSGNQANKGVTTNIWPNLYHRKAQKKTKRRRDAMQL